MLDLLSNIYVTHFNETINPIFNTFIVIFGDSNFTLKATIFTIYFHFLVILKFYTL